MTGWSFNTHTRAHEGLQTRARTHTHMDAHIRTYTHAHIHTYSMRIRTCSSRYRVFEDEMTIWIMMKLYTNSLSLLRMR